MASSPQIDADPPVLLGAVARSASFAGRGARGTASAGTGAIAAGASLAEAA